MEKLSFTGSNGHTLSAKLDIPDEGEIKAYALYAHCFTCSKEIFAANRIAIALNALGIAMLRFDFAGIGQSEGDFADTNFTTNIEDLTQAYKFMTAQGMSPDILIGHSLGGSACLAAASTMPNVKAIATIGAPADVTHVTHHFDTHMDEINTHGLANLELVGRPFTIKKQFIDDLKSQNLDRDIQNLKKALLVLHSPIDDTVSIENAEHIYKNAKHPKSFVTLNCADHLLNTHKDAAYAGRIIAAWASHYAGYKLTDIDKKRTFKERGTKQS
jgi:esterase/lipase